MRLDTHVYQGYRVPPFYDSLLAKFIVWGRSRDEALGTGPLGPRPIRRRGRQDDHPVPPSCIDHPLFVKGEISTHFIEDHLMG